MNISFIEIKMYIVLKKIKKFSNDNFREAITK